jgi:hypothetical protein
VSNRAGLELHKGTFEIARDKELEVLFGVTSDPEIRVVSYSVTRARVLQNVWDLKHNLDSLQLYLMQKDLSLY